MKTKCLILLMLASITCTSLFAQLSPIDTADFNQKMLAYSAYMQERMIGLSKKLEQEYSKDPSVFMEKDGRKSVIKVLIRAQELLLPEKRKYMNEWAKQSLNEEEYEHFKTLNLTTGQTTGVPVLTFGNTIDYDSAWIANFWVNTGLILKPDFSFLEKVYYLSAYDITNVVEPKYMEKILTENDANMYMLRSLFNAALEYFIILHEFYHSYYEDRLSIQDKDEIAADNYALAKWVRFAAGADTNKFISDSDLRNTGGFIGLNSLIVGIDNDAGCGGGILLNKNVLNRNFLKSYLGINLVGLMYHSDLRFLLTKKDQILKHVTRMENFTSIAWEGLVCADNSKTTLCCGIDNQRKDLLSVKEALKSFRPLIVDKIACDTASYSKIFPGEPSVAAFELGNYWAVTKRNYKKALEFFNSANQLQENSNYTVLCNLMCYEIYSNIPMFINKEKAKVHLEKAKRMNAVIPTIREEIIRELSAD